MSWEIPRHPIVVREIVDSEDLNDNISAMASEASRLSESNWTSGTLQAASDTGLVATDVGLRIYPLIRTSDPHGAGGIEVPQSLAWETISESSQTFESRGGVVHSICSFQLANNPTDDDSKQTGLMFCLTLNGAPQYSSLIGSGDLSNDQKERPLLRYDLTTGSFDAVPSDYYGTGPAVKAIQHGLTIQLSVRVSPGQHTIALACRNLSLDTLTIGQEITQITHIIRDMWI